MSIRDLFLIRDDVTFLNHGSFGACPKPVFDVYQDWQRQMEAQPVEFLGRQSAALLAHARADLGAYLGSDADELVFVSNATTAVNIIARSLDLKPGDEVLATDHEYGALDRAWTNVARQTGCRYIRQEIPLPLYDVHQILDRIADEWTSRTRVLYLSHITSPTALTMPLRQLVLRARDEGVVTLIDGAHAPGQIPLDLDSLGVDFYTGNAHKWMMAPKGCAFLYARKDMQQLVRPLVVSWGTGALPDSRFIQELEWQGTRDISAFLSISAAIAFMEEHDWTSVRSRCHEHARRFREGMAEITGLPPICPDSSDWFAQMYAAPLQPCDGDAFQKALYDRYRIEIPVTELGDDRFLRISVQAYNSGDDIERVLDSVEKTLPEFLATN